MESGNEKKDGNFRWTDNDVTVLCEVCINYIHRNGRGQAFRWHEIHKEVQEKTGRQYQFKSVKNKFDTMRTDWYLWKFLKNEETGHGWDPISGRISASEEWWKNKIAAKPDAKKFKNKPLHPTMEDLYFQIFEGKRATKEGVVAPSMDPSSVNVVNVEDDLNEEEGEDDAYNEYTQHSSVLGSLEGQEQSFYRNFLKEVTSDTQAPTSNQGLDDNFDTQVPHLVHSQNTSVAKATMGERRSTSYSSKLPQSSIRKFIKPTQMKRRRRQSAGSAMLSGQIGDMVNTCNRALEILESDVNTSNPPTSVEGSSNNTGVGSKDSSVGMAMDVVSRMVSECWLVKGSELWCFLIHLLEDSVRRELFLKMEDDNGRMAWLNFMHRRDK